MVTLRRFAIPASTHTVPLIRAPISVTFLETEIPFRYYIKVTGSTQKSSTADRVGFFRPLISTHSVYRKVVQAAL